MHTSFNRTSNRSGNLNYHADVKQNHPPRVKKIVQILGKEYYQGHDGKLHEKSAADKMFGKIKVDATN